MKTLRYLTLAGALLMAAPKANSQDIPSFKRSFVADTKVPLVSAQGPILWMSQGYNSDGYELRGYIDIPIRIAGIFKINALHFKLGAITRIEGNTIESIIYTSTRTKEKLSEYDKMIAQREGINTDKLVSLWHEKYDLSNKTITNLETGEVVPMGTSSEFQQMYFNIPKNKDLDTLVTVHFCGRNYPVNVKIKDGTIMADLTYIDSSGQRKDLVEGIKSMSVHTDSNGLPEKMVAEAQFEISKLAVQIHPECKYDPLRKWEELR